MRKEENMKTSSCYVITFFQPNGGTFVNLIAYKTKEDALTAANERMWASERIVDFQITLVLIH
jgi:hypothetical protein